MSKVAVIQFPGSNCEYETKRSLDSLSVPTDIVRWNTDFETLRQYDAYILPGGFSYQDRVRSGAIAAKLPIMDILLEADAKGKPILGICNGCQILAEAGLVPNSNGNGHIEIALTHNRRKEDPQGFVCDWVFVRFQHPEKNVFTRYFSSEDILPIPVNHGEGRFVLSDTLRSQFNTFTHALYCTATGDISADYPTTPNGSYHALAALSNHTGNVLAMMPHPERARFLKQIPFFIDSTWAQEKHRQTHFNQDGPFVRLFASLKDTLHGN